jgi:hypothetical protein
MRLLILFLFSYSIHALEYQGLAYKDKKLVYTEVHDETRNEYTITATDTKYVDPKGKVLSTLVSDHSKSLRVPNHHFKDPRSGYEHGIEKGKKCFRRGESGQKKEYEECKPEKNSVSSKGLHAWLVQNLHKFKKGDKKKIDFILPGKEGRFDFLMKVRKANNKVVEIDLEVKSWVLRLFAPKMYLKYDRQTRNLLVYKGPSNIVDEKGKTFNVTIKYQY